MTVESKIRQLVEAAGGPARVQVICLLAAVLGLDTADKGAVSAVSGQLKEAFAIGNTEFGLLLAVVSFAGALGAIPMGILVDRMKRRNILLAAIAAWTVAMVLSGTATSYLYLILMRLLLGFVTAAAWPCVASLTGDFFPARERAGIYGLILSGELLGVGIGFFVAGEVSALLDWQWAFFAMAALSLAVLVAIWRYLPEPARGTQTWLGRGESDPDAASQVRSGGEAGQEESSGEPRKARQIVRRSGVEPREELVLHEDPVRRGWLWAIRYCLEIPSYRLLVIASALAYYFFSGMRAFVMIHFTDHWGVSHGIVSALVILLGAGAILGMIGGGRLSEWLLARGRLSARIVIPGVALIPSVPFLGFGIWTGSVGLGVLLMTLGAATRRRRRSHRRRPPRHPPSPPVGPRRGRAHGAASGVRGQRAASLRRALGLARGRRPGAHVDVPADADADDRREPVRAARTKNLSARRRHRRGLGRCRFRGDAQRRPAWVDDGPPGRTQARSPGTVSARAEAGSRS